ncbi:MAG: pantothenate kinase [Cyanobacteria bacterium P01_H01_bin.58]
MIDPSSKFCNWLALVAGNTRLHWASFQDSELQAVWHTSHLNAEVIQHLVNNQFSSTAWQKVTDRVQLSEEQRGNLNFAKFPLPLPLYLASVVPQQTALWQFYPGLVPITLAQLPLGHLYPTLGIDRALNLLGAGERYGWPVLIIDAGTTLTFTAGTDQGLTGGAILPGLAMQFRALGEHTASLPAMQWEATLPPRWAQTTSQSIQSGVLYGAIATIRDFIRAWRQSNSQGHIVLTGGDGQQLYQWLQHNEPISNLQYAPHLTFWGVAAHRRNSTLQATDP